MKLLDKSNIINGWRENNVREWIEAFVDKGLEQVCAGDLPALSIAAAGAPSGRSAIDTQGERRRDDQEVS